MSRARRHTTCTGSDSPSHRTEVRRYVVPLDHRLQGLQIVLQSGTAVKPSQVKQQVGINIARHQVVKQNPFLQWRQRIDVLDVGCPSRHGHHYALDLFATQLHQRQHFWVDRLAFRRNPIGRHINDTAVTSHRRCEFS